MLPSLGHDNLVSEPAKIHTHKITAPFPAHYLFDKMSSSTKVFAGGVLRVTVHYLYYPVTEETLQQVFGAYGVLNISMSQRSDHVEAVIQF
jgi:hypothetical protein